VTERVGFIGLGLMGKPMARNLLRAGLRLTVHSRSSPPVDELVGAGAARASNPAEVVAASDVVVTTLPDTPDVELVLFGPDGVGSGAREGSLLIRLRHGRVGVHEQRTEGATWSLAIALSAIGGFLAGAGVLLPWRARPACGRPRSSGRRSLGPSPPGGSAT
jgi:hypothetical protein